MLKENLVKREKQILVKTYFLNYEIKLFLYIIYFTVCPSVVETISHRFSKRDVV